jgi:hypothetical protein
MITTKEIMYTHPQDLSKKWYSEEEIRKAIDKIPSQGHCSTCKTGDDNLICVNELLKELFGNEKVDKNE